MITGDGDTELIQLQQHVPFTMVENSIIQTITDYVALGLYLDMRSRPPGWRINLPNLARNKKQGRDSLSAAMKQLIQLELVFRVKYQRPGGQWATRIYVAQRPVTVEELLQVRESYSQRCSITTSDRLLAAANPPRTNSTGNTADKASGRTNDLVGPTDGNPSLGHPTVAQPAAGPPTHGTPTSEDPTSNYQEERDQLPPPTPSNSNHSLKEEEEDDGKANHSLDTVLADAVQQVLEAVAGAWPRLGRQDVQRLAYPILAALQAGVDPRTLIDHLTTNPGGVRSPIHVLLARCANHPRPQPPAPVKTPWCGDCRGPNHRWLEVGPNRYPSPCPRCNDSVNRPGPHSAYTNGERNDRHIGDIIAKTRDALRSRTPDG